MFGIRRRVIWSWVAGALTVAVICRGVADRAWDRSARAELNQARAELDTGLVATATALRTLADGHRQRDEALELLGRCEQTLGRNDAALAAWGRIAASSPLYPRVAADRGALLLNTGHYRAAEEFLGVALSGPGRRLPMPATTCSPTLPRLSLPGTSRRHPPGASRLHGTCVTNRAALLRELWLLDMSPPAARGRLGNGASLGKPIRPTTRSAWQIAVAHFWAVTPKPLPAGRPGAGRPDDPAVAAAAARCVPRHQ